MTVRAIGSMNNRFCGLSSDTKPTDLEEGAEFHAVDTGAKYIFHDGMWVEDLREIYAIQTAAI